MGSELSLEGMATFCPKVSLALLVASTAAAVLY